MYQPQPGSFYWTRFKIGQGVEFNPPAWLGDAFVFRGDGTYYWDTDYFFCKRVGGQTYTYWPGSAPYNSSSYGGWEQWSGAGDASCYGSYIAKDWQFVQAQQ